MKSKSVCSVVVAVVTGLAALSAQSEILMYDGFPIGSNGYSSTDGDKLNGQSVPLTSPMVKGFANTGWSSGTGVIYSFTSGLSLPASFADLPAAAFAGSGAVGSKADGSNDERGMWKDLSTDVVDAMKTASELHFRFVMSASASSLGALTVSGSADKVPNKSAYSAGLFLSSASAYGSVRNSNGKTTRSLGFAIRRVAGDACKVSLLLFGTEDTSQADFVRTYDLMDYTGGETVICYAKVTVGGGTDGKDKVEALVQPVDSYNPSLPFQVAAEAKLIDDTGTGAPNALNFALGSYTVKKGPVLFDEFALATDGHDIMVLAADGAPTLRSSALTPTETGFDVSATLSNAAATVGAIADDGSASVSFSGGEKELGEDGTKPFSVAIPSSALSANTGYQVSVYAENEKGATTNAVGTVYSGDVSLMQTRNGSEDGPVAAQFTVSIPVASAFDHTISYTLGGTAESGVGYQPLPGKVTIPAGQTSAVIEVMPLIDPDSEAKTVELTLAPGAYGVSASASTASASIANLDLPTDYTTWIATEKANASVVEKWSAGLPLASNPKQPLMDGRFSNADIYWDLNPDNADGVLRPIKFADYTGAFSLNTTVPTTLRQGDLTFMANKLVVGSDRSTVATFDGGTYTVNGLLSCGNNSAAGVSLTVTNATFSSTQTLIGGTSADNLLRIASDTTYNGGSLTMGGGASATNSRLLVDEGATATFNGMSVATCGQTVVVEGEVVNSGTLSLSTRGNNSQSGSSLIIRKNGHFVQNAACKICCWYYATCRVEDGGRLEVPRNAIAIGNDSDSGKGGKLIVSNATVTASSISVCSDDRHEQQYLYLYGDKGQTSRIETTGGLVVAPEQLNCRNGKSNRIYVRGGELSVGGAIRVGTPYETAQGNIFDIACSNSKVTAKSATFNNDSMLKFTVPREGFDAVPLQLEGALVFNSAAKMVVDVSESKGGRHVLLSAGSLPENVLERVEIVSSKYPAEARVRGNSVVVTVKGGFSVVIR